MEEGFRTGAIARVVDLHAHFYARHADFGCFFEATVATEFSAFCLRLSKQNRLWLAMRSETVVGSIAIDGDGLEKSTAHLRWFILDEAARGHGIGLRMLSTALAFCDRRGFAKTELWTLSGLDAARKLYEAAGFTIAEESEGRRWGKRVVEQRYVRSRPL